MKTFKKALKLAFLALVIALACFGVSLSGGVPLPFSRKRDNTVEIKIEMVDMKEDKTDAATADFYQ